MPQKYGSCTASCAGRCVGSRPRKSRWLAVARSRGLASDRLVESPRRCRAGARRQSNSESSPCRAPLPWVKYAVVVVHQIVMDLTLYGAQGAVSARQSGSPCSQRDRAVCAMNHPGRRRPRHLSSDRRADAVHPQAACLSHCDWTGAWRRVSEGEFESTDRAKIHGVRCIDDPGRRRRTRCLQT